MKRFSRTRLNAAIPTLAISRSPSLIVVMVILTTLLTPPILTFLIKKQQ